MGLAWGMTPYVLASMPMMIGFLAMLFMTRRGAGWYQRQLQQGAPATVSVIEVNEVAINHLGHVLQLRLAIHQPGQPETERDGKINVNSLHRGQIKPGTELSIRVDRNTPDVAAVAWPTSTENRSQG